MIEPQPPASLEPVPTAGEAASDRRTTLIVWALVVMAFAGGLAIMAVGWRDVQLPSFAQPSFDVPEIQFPVPDATTQDPEAPVVIESEALEDMVVSRGPDARPVGQADGPPKE
jgi:hypothetical protein